MAICWFCESNKAGSREHMFPRWLNNVIPGQLGPHIDVSETQRRENNVQERQWLRTGPANETVRSVCRDCNEGWMAQLEIRAKLVLSPLIRGERAMLKVEELLLVATWAAKTASVIESRNPPVQYVSTPEARAILMNEGRPPSSIQVDAFTFGGEPLSGYWRRAVAINQHLTKAASDTANYAVTVMTFGHLGLRVVEDWANLHAPLSGIKAPAIPGVISIYPSLCALSWPSGPILGEDDLDAVRTAAMQNESFKIDSQVNQYGTKKLWLP